MESTGSSNGSPFPNFQSPDGKIGDLQDFDDCNEFEIDLNDIDYSQITKTADNIVSFSINNQVSDDELKKTINSIAKENIHFIIMNEDVGSITFLNQETTSCKICAIGENALTQRILNEFLQRIKEDVLQRFKIYIINNIKQSKNEKSVRQSFTESYTETHTSRVPILKLRAILEKEKRVFENYYEIGEIKKSGEITTVHLIHNKNKKHDSENIDLK